jgi:hypothetical protein
MIPVSPYFLKSRVRSGVGNGHRVTVCPKGIGLAPSFDFQHLTRTPWRGSGALYAELVLKVRSWRVPLAGP